MLNLIKNKNKNISAVTVYYQFLMYYCKKKLKKVYGKEKTGYQL